MGLLAAQAVGAASNSKQASAAVSLHWIRRFVLALNGLLVLGTARKAENSCLKGLMRASLFRSGQTSTHDYGSVQSWLAASTSGS